MKPSKQEPVLPFEPSKPKSGSIESLANYLPLEDLAKLIEINSARIIVFNQGTKTVDELSEHFSVCMNGASIQITVNDDISKNDDELEEILNG
jgi:hypothetical protein